MGKLICLSLMIAATACGKGDKKSEGGGGGGGLAFQSACDYRGKENTCVEYFGTGASKTHCTDNGGTAIDRCPKDDSLGRCVSTEIGVQQVLFYPPYTKERAEVVCKAMGDGKLQAP